jgi:hypothetical protein
VRHRRLLQIGGRAGKNERGKWGGGGGRLGAAWRKGKLSEREGPERGGQQHGAKDVAGNGPGRWARTATLLRKQGREAGRG